MPNSKEILWPAAPETHFPWERYQNPNMPGQFWWFHHTENRVFIEPSLPKPPPMKAAPSTRLQQRLGAGKGGTGDTGAATI